MSGQFLSTWFFSQRAAELNWIYALLHSSAEVVGIPDIPRNRMITTCLPSLHRQELLFSLQDNLATPLNILYLIFLSLSTISPIRISTIKVLYTSPQQEIQPNPSHPYSHRLVLHPSLTCHCLPLALLLVKISLDPFYLSCLD